KRKHSQEYKHFLESKRNNQAKVISPKQRLISSFGSLDKKEEKYKRDDPKQKDITDKLINVVCSNMLALRIVDDQDFKEYTASLNPKYEYSSIKFIFSSKLSHHSKN